MVWASLWLSAAVFVIMRRPKSYRLMRLITHRPAVDASPGSPRSSPGVGGVLAFVGVVAVLGPWPGLLLGAAAGIAVTVGISRMETSEARARRKRIAADMPIAVDLLVATLEAGRPQSLSFALVGGSLGGPLGAEFIALARRLDSGGDPIAVWQELRGDAHLGSIARAFARASTSGASVSRVLARTADELRRDQHGRAQEVARSVAVASAAPLGLCFLPAFILVGIVPMIVGAFSGLTL